MYKYWSYIRLKWYTYTIFYMQYQLWQIFSTFRFQCKNIDLFLSFYFSNRNVRIFDGKYLKDFKVTMYHFDDMGIATKRTKSWNKFILHHVREKSSFFFIVFVVVLSFAWLFHIYRTAVRLWYVNGWKCYLRVLRLYHFQKKLQ